MIVITGGAGFIGSNLVNGLEKQTQEPLVICDTLGTDQKWRNIAKRQIDELVAPDQLLEFIKLHGRDINIIYHMGAISSTTESDADLVYRTNCKLSKDLLHASVENDIRFIYASSAATYGDGTKGFEDDTSAEFLGQLQPLNVYGWSKQWFDRYVMNRKIAQAPLPPQYVGLKFFNVYGPNEYHKGSQQSVVPKIFREVQGGGPIRLFKSGNPNYKDGQQTRDFVWVGDCVNVMLWLKDAPKVNGIYNVGTGQARTFYDLAMAVNKALNQSSEVEFFDMPEVLNDTYQYYTQANLNRLRQAGYTAEFTSLEQGVGTYVQDYLAASDSYL